MQETVFRHIYPPLIYACSFPNKSMFIPYSGIILLYSKKTFVFGLKEFEKKGYLSGNIGFFLEFQKSGRQDLFY